MARIGPEARLSEIARAGATWFGRLGYRRTRMAEVATESGLSAGAIYTYVESKEALFHLVLLAGFGDPLPRVEDLPLPTPDLQETLELIDRDLKREGSTPILRAALDTADPADVRSELAAIVTEQYSNVERLRRALSVIEACAVDLPALDELYFGRRRRGQIDLLVRYVQRRAASGHLANLPDMAVAAQIVTEAIAWFAWKRHEGHDAKRFDDETARLTVVEFACNALIPPGRAT